MYDLIFWIVAVIYAGLLWWGKMRRLTYCVEDGAFSWTALRAAMARRDRVHIVTLLPLLAYGVYLWRKDLAATITAYVLLYLLLDMVMDRRDRQAPRALTSDYRNMLIVQVVMIAAWMVLCRLLADVWVPLAFCLLDVLSPIVVLLSSRLVRHRPHTPRAVREDPENRPYQVIAISGSFGKSSVKHYLAALLADDCRVQTTPDSVRGALDFAQFMRKGVAADTEILIAELNAKKPGEVRRQAASIRPDMTVITGVSERFLDTFHTMPNLVKSVMEAASAVTVMPADDACLKGHAVRGHALYCGTDMQCDVAVRDVLPGADGTQFTLRFDGVEHTYHTALLGRHNVQNLALAVCAARALGVDATMIDRRISAMARLEGKSFLRQVDSVTFFVDSHPTTLDGCLSTLEVLRCFDGQRILMTEGIPSLGDRSKALNRAFGREAASVCSDIFVVNSQAAPFVVGGARECGMERSHLHSVESWAEAFAALRAMQGERTVLLHHSWTQAKKYWK